MPRAVRWRSTCRTTTRESSGPSRPSLRTTPTPIHPSPIRSGPSSAGCSPRSRRGIWTMPTLFAAVPRRSRPRSSWPVRRRWRSATGTSTRSSATGTPTTGMTLGTVGVSHNPASQAAFEPMLPKWPHIRQYSDFDRPDGMSREEWGVECAGALEYAIHYAGARSVAAFLATPHGCGPDYACVPPDSYWRTIREICDRYEVLIITDEVITGFGPHGQVVRHGPLRHRSGHHDHGQGHLQLLRALRRRVGLQPAQRALREGPFLRARPSPSAGTPWAAPSDAR